MYATVVRCDVHDLTAATADGGGGRALATALAAVPGFVACVALDSDAAAGTVTAVCLVEERAGLAEAERVIAWWQREQGMAGGGVRRLGAGTVIAQWGL